MSEVNNDIKLLLHYSPTMFARAAGEKHNKNL